MRVQFRELQDGDLALLAATGGGAAWNTRSGKWNRYWIEHQDGARIVLLADLEGQIVGYGSLVWVSQYPCFRGAGIPEIQDLVVAEKHRGAGLGTRLIHALESRARAAGHLQLGIGVGLHRDYGSAQRLYSSLGYIPDGRGITWNNEPVVPGKDVRVDDDLVLWLTKDLDRAAPLP
jgi:GNAT superfamily N-acetyltransferase